jgi:hypothetical protein
MSTTPNTGFNPFAPGLDFLQSLSKSAQASAGAAMPAMASWATPTLEPEELDKRITDLKTVHYWLDQNAKALAATIQALEVQRLTLSTLKSMNVNLGEMARAFQTPAAKADAPASEPVAEPAEAAEPTAAAPTQPTPAAEPAAPKAKDKASTSAKASADKPAALGDPLQLWNSLTQQFQNIAANALRDSSQLASGAQATDKATDKPATSSRKRTPAKTSKAKSSSPRKPKA